MTETAPLRLVAEGNDAPELVARPGIKRARLRSRPDWALPCL
jgi:hypothetical protein